MKISSDDPYELGVTKGKKYQSGKLETSVGRPQLTGPM